MEEQPLIIVVEDDEATAAFLADNLIADEPGRAGRQRGRGGWRSRCASRASALLDLRSAGRAAWSCWTACGRRRLATRIDPQLPVMVLTGRAGEADRVRSLNRGADDHLCKPFYMRNCWPACAQCCGAPRCGAGSAPGGWAN